MVLRASLSISTQQEKNWSPWLASCFNSSVEVVRLTPVINRRFAFCRVNSFIASSMRATPPVKHGNAVGGAGFRLAALDAAGEDEEADDEQNDGEQQPDRRSGARQRQKAPNALRFRLDVRHRLLPPCHARRKNRH